MENKKRISDLVLAALKDSKCQPIAGGKENCKYCRKSFISVSKTNRKKTVFCSRNCWYEYSSKNIRGEKKGVWKGGKVNDGFGYIRVLVPNHPYKNHLGYVLEHRLVMEKHLGRYLFPGEVVHHVNNVRNDNRSENLMLFSDTGQHTKWHKPLKIYCVRGHLIPGGKRRCRECGKIYEKKYREKKRGQ